MFDYETFTLRNNGYIDKALQAKIKETKVLIAGCGMGSTIAEVMLRSGFVNLVLADADEVAEHNLNRQCFINDDINTPKTTALSKRLKSIYPNANITEFNEFIGPDNAAELISNVDFIIDTIDFIDLPGVTSLYDNASQQSKPVVSAINAGYGAIALYYPHINSCTFRQLFGLPESGSVEGISYAEKYMSIIKHLAKYLNPQIVTEMSKALGFMEDGKPCPASQISPGSYTAGTLATTIVIKHLAGETIAAVPKIIMLDLATTIKESVIDLQQ
ncbi:MAG: thiamine biosynthesis protein ThiF [Planctomycetota bacterium]|nr:MAG: thiamine biosynthesis protein ThiF [Planctomycetota bacterium]